MISSPGMTQSLENEDSGRLTEAAPMGEQPFLSARPDPFRVHMGAVHRTRSGRSSFLRTPSSSANGTVEMGTSVLRQQGAERPQARSGEAPAAGNPADISSDTVRLGSTLVSRAVTSSFVSQQVWEGRVEHVGSNSFVARLSDKTNSTGEAEAEFDLSEISPDDKPYVKPGALFVWHLGKDQIWHETPDGVRAGQIRKVSVLLFRRLPRWTQRDLSELQKETAELACVLED